MDGGALTISEASRHALHTRLSEVHREKEVVVLMEHLPPAGWTDVATKRDLDALGQSLRGEIAGLRGEMHGEIGRLEGKLDALGGQLRQEITRQQRAMYFGTVATILSTFGALGGLAALLH